jgi:adenylosuccinate lyase
VIFSGSVLLELAKRDVSREQAYEWVQRNALRSVDERLDFKLLLLADADVSRVVPRADLERAFDLDEQFKHVDDIFDRVFGPASDAGDLEAAEAVASLPASRALT